MRKDLNKLLCERERRGSHMRYKDVRRKKRFRVEDEEAPIFESTKFRYDTWGSRKNFNENLNPLKGQIRKFVGKPWNTFYSELSKVFDKRSVINQHILQHLDDFVVRNVKIKDDGKIYVTGKYGFADSLLENHRCDFYVDPRDGILKRNDKLSRKAKAELRAKKNQEELNAKFHRIDKTNVLHKIDGVWFHFELKPLPIGSYTYEKFIGQDYYNVSWSNTETKMKHWENLTDLEKRRVGKKVFVGDYAKDVFDGSEYFLDKDSKKAMYHGGSWVYGNNPMRTYGMYHASKKTASHSLLKKMGIVK